MAPDSDFVAATSIRAINNSSKAYSTISCPFSSFHRHDQRLGMQCSVYADDYAPSSVNRANQRPLGISREHEKEHVENEGLKLEASTGSDSRRIRTLHSA